MLLSIVVPCFNAGKYLCGLIASVEAAGISGLQDVEVILVNDGSTDDTLSVLEELSKHHRYIRYFSKQNGGPAAARNFGAERAAGEYLMFLDADDELAGSALVQVDAFLAASPGRDFYIGRYAILEADGSPARAMPAVLTGASAKACVEDYLSGRVSIQQGAYVVRRALFLACRFPEGLKTQEDVPFFLACLARGNVCCMPVDMLRYHKYRGTVSKARHVAVREGFASFDALFQPPYVAPALLGLRCRLYRARVRTLLRYISALGDSADIRRVMKAYRERVGARVWLDVPLGLKLVRTWSQVRLRQREVAANNES